MIVIEKVPETPLLTTEIQAELKRRAEQAEIRAAVPQLRSRLGNIIRGNMSLPSDIEGKRVVLETPQYANPEDDWMRLYPDSVTSDVHARLSPTRLHCTATTSDAEEVSFVIESSGYPLRPVNMSVTTKSLGYCLALPAQGAFEVRFPMGGRVKSRPSSMVDVRLLEEILGLMEGPSAKFTSQPYTIVQTC